MIFLYPEIRVIPVYVEHWLSLCRECDRWVTRVFWQWSRHQHLAKILLDPVQIQCTLTSCGKACSVLTHPALSCPDLSFPVLSWMALCCPIRSDMSWPFLSGPVVSCSILTSPVLSYLVLSSLNMTWPFLSCLSDLPLPVLTLFSQQQLLEQKSLNTIGLRPHRNKSSSSLDLKVTSFHNNTFWCLC